MQRLFEAITGGGGRSDCLFVGDDTRDVTVPMWPYETVPIEPMWTDEE